MSEELPTPLYHLDSDQVYEPREDTFLLLDALERDLPALRSARLSLVLEIGPGSGVVVTAIAKALVGSACLAVDINPFACTTTKKTSATNGTHVEVVNGDLLNAVVARNAIDLLIFNPPYVPSDPEDETQLIDKAWAGSELGRSTTDRLFPVLPELMSFACVGYLVVIEENQPDQMADQLSLKGFDCSFVAHRNVRGERLRILRFSRGLAEELRQLN